MENEMKKNISNRFLMAIVALGFGVRAMGTAFDGITTNMTVYDVRDGSDTWANSTLSVYNHLILESNASINLVSSTLDFLRPYSIASRQTNWVGRTGPATLWASNSTLHANFHYRIGMGSGAANVELIDSTMRVYRDPFNGTFEMVVGQGNGCTGSIKLVRSRLLYDNAFYGGRLVFGAGLGFGRLSLTRSTLGQFPYTFECLTSGYSSMTKSIKGQTEAIFNSSTVVVTRCSFGGDPVYGQNNGYCMFTNGSLLNMTGVFANWYNPYPGLWVGRSCSGIGYTSTVTITGSRVLNKYLTVVGQEAGTGQGILTFCDNAIGILNDTVTLGVKRSSTAGPSFGHLAIRSGAQVFATNTITTSRLTVGEAGRGLLTIDGGACHAYRLYATNSTDSVINFCRGLLTLNMGTISKQTPFVIGDGGGAATLAHWGGGLTEVFGDMAFSPLSQWKIGMDETSEPVLDVHGELTFAPGTTLEVDTVQEDLDVFDGLVIAHADSISGMPPSTQDPDLRVRVSSLDGRKALVLRYANGTVMFIR